MPHEDKPHYGAARETLDRTVDWSQKGCGGGMLAGLVVGVVISVIAFPPLLLLILPIAGLVAYLLLRRPREAPTESSAEPIAENTGDLLAHLDFGARGSVRLYPDHLILTRGALSPQPVASLPLSEASMEIAPKAAGNAGFVITDAQGEVFASHDAVRLAKAERFLSRIHAARSSAEHSDSR